MLSFSFRVIHYVVYTFVSRLLFSSALVWRVSLGSCLFQKVTCFIGAHKLLEGLLRACEQCPGKSSQCLIVSLFSNKEVILGSITFSPTGLLW